MIAARIPRLTKFVALTATMLVLGALVVGAQTSRAYGVSTGPAPVVTNVPTAFNGFSFSPTFSATANTLHHVEFFCQVNDGAIGDCDGPLVMPFCVASGGPNLKTCTSSYRQSQLDEGVYKFAFYVGQCDQVSRVDCVNESDWFLGAPHVANVAIDRTPPVAVIVNPNAAPTTSKPLLKPSKPVFEFSASEDSTFECRLGSHSFGVCTSPFKLNYPLRNKTYEFRVRAIDLAGNVSPSAVKRFTVEYFRPKRCGKKRGTAKTKCKRQNAAAKKRWKRKHQLR